MAFYSNAVSQWLMLLFLFAASVPNTATFAQESSSTDDANATSGELSGEVYARHEAFDSDRIQHRLKTATGEAKLDLLRQLYVSYAKWFMAPDSVLWAINSWQEEALRQQNPAHVLMSEFGMVVYEDISGNVQQALKRAYPVAHYSARFGLDSVEIKVLDRIGYMEMERGVYEKSLEAFGRAEIIAHRMDDADWKAYISNGKGYVYGLMGDTTASIASYRKGWQLAINNQLVGYVPEVGLALSTTYSEINRPDSARFYLEQLERDTVLSKRFRGIYDWHWAFYHREKGDRDSAEVYFQRSLKTMDPELDFHDKAIMQQEYAELLQSQGRSREALVHANDALAVFQELEDIKTRLQTLQVLQDIHGSLGNKDAQIEYYKQFQKLSVAYQKQRDAERLTAQQEQLDAQKARFLIDRAAEKREQQALRESYFYTYAIFGGITLLIFMVAVTLRMRVTFAWMEGLSFMLTILFFEAILVFIDPLVVPYTDGKPFPTLLFNGALAIVLTILHAQLLRWLLRKRRQAAKAQA